MYVNSLLSHKETDALFFSWSKTHDSPLAKSIFKYTSERERESRTYLNVRHTFCVAWFFFFPIESKKKKSGSGRSLLQKL